MANLDHLKIKTAPGVFAGWARNFNQQVDLIASIQGGPGVQADVAHSPRKIHRGPVGSNPKEQPRGKIMISLRPSAIQGLGIGSGSGNSNVGNTTQAIGINGLLLDVLQPNSPNTPVTYPTTLRAGNGASYVLANASGVQAVNANFSFVATPTDATLTVAATQKVVSNSTGFAVLSGNNSCAIPFASITRPMSIKTITVCDNGNARFLDIIASEPYV